jgi:hypothetical protein
MVNDFAGSRRLIAHIFIAPKQPGWMDEVESTWRSRRTSQIRGRATQWAIDCDELGAASLFGEYRNLFFGLSLILRKGSTRNEFSAHLVAFLFAVAVQPYGARAHTGGLRRWATLAGSHGGTAGAIMRSCWSLNSARNVWAGARLANTSRMHNPTCG